jgi:hypothetical protein
MKKILTVVLFCLILTGLAQSQVKVNISLVNPGVEAGLFKFDVRATVQAGQTWKVGSSNIRVDFVTVPPGMLTVHPDAAVSGALACLNSGNYSAMTTTSINGGTAISLNIIRLSACCVLTPGTYLLGRIRFNRLDTTSTTCDTIRYTSVMTDSITVLTYGTGWTRTNPVPPCPIVTGVNVAGTDIPTVFKLYNNYPNPFNPATTFKYDIPKTSLIKITIFDVLGKEVEVLVNETKTPGRYEIKWDASNYASGAYMYKFESDEFTDIKKMMLVK